MFSLPQSSDFECCLNTQEDGALSQFFNQAQDVYLRIICFGVVGFLKKNLVVKTDCRVSTFRNNYATI